MLIEGYTDIGVRYPNNQDTFWSAKVKADDREYAILAMCDGMGGLDDGSFASSLVISSIRDSIIAGLISKEDIYNAILSANQQILDKYKETNKQCGTTCTVAVIGGGYYYGWHIGDTRFYQFRGNSYRVLTEDHTVLNNKRKKGIDVTEELTKKYKSILSRCIGVSQKPRLDSFEGDYESGDVFIACSDGFWNFWNMDTSSLQERINEVKVKGERDNITVVSARV